VELRERIEALPGVPALLAALPSDPVCHLVGGAVRDALLGLRPLDLDGCVDGDAAGIAAEVAARLGGEARVHDAFGTATVRAPGVVFDLARTRRERYERPGALPVVEPAPLAEDLGRRDFTVNAMAVPLAGAATGSLVDLHGGLGDLEARVIRVLHPRSFVDDPTRLLRAVRYEGRLGARMERRTEQLARESVTAGALGTVSGPRLRDELLDLLGEPAAPASVERLAELGLLAALHPALGGRRDRVGPAVERAREVGADPALAGLAALILGAPRQLEGWLDALGLTAGTRARVVRAARRAPELHRALLTPLRRADLHALLRPEPPEALALALALGAPEEPVRLYLDALRDVRLEVTGRELIEAGVPPSPRLGRALEETLRRKLDGELAGAEEELRAALEVARRDDGGTG
jgi:tRNA nucleotidyltransferase (CCA-adding enzyme)